MVADWSSMVRGTLIEVPHHESLVPGGDELTVEGVVQTEFVSRQDTHPSQGKAPLLRAVGGLIHPAAKFGDSSILHRVPLPSHKGQHR